MANITIEDLNGNFYLGAFEGENLEAVQSNVIILSNDFPVASAPLAKAAINVEQATVFLKLNAHAVKIHFPDLSDDVCLYIAYLRLLVIKHGLAAPDFQPAMYHVHYNEVARLNVANTNAAVNAAENANFDNESISGKLTAPVKKILRDTFADRVCLVAHVFRARGHHYMDSYEELYKRVWDRMNYRLDLLLVPFKYLATTAFHAIYPVILDNFWNYCIQNSLCNGALIKRFDGAPAGAAGPYVLDQGARDLDIIAPGLRNKVPEQFEYLDQVMAQLKANRWNGSVNAKYYGARRLMTDEKKLGVIAATLVASLNALADDSPLNNSPALKRIATNAPLVGAIFARTIRNISDRPEQVNDLLKPANKPRAIAAVPEPVEGVGAVQNQVPVQADAPVQAAEAAAGLEVNE